MLLLLRQQRRGCCLPGRRVNARKQLVELMPHNVVGGASCFGRLHSTKEETQRTLCIDPCTHSIPRPIACTGAVAASSARLWEIIGRRRIFGASAPAAPLLYFFDKNCRCRPLAFHLPPMNAFNFVIFSRPFELQSICSFRLRCEGCADTLLISE